MKTAESVEPKLGPLPAMPERRWLHVGWPASYGDALYRTALCGAGVVPPWYVGTTYVGPHRETCPDCARISRERGWA